MSEGETEAYNYYAPSSTRLASYLMKALALDGRGSYRKQSFYLFRLTLHMDAF